MENLNENIVDKTGLIRDKQGKFVEGVSGNPQGRTPETLEQKIIKKATKELISDYKEKLAEALPEISPVLISKAISGDIQAIKELHDRVMGKPEQQTDITSGGKPVQILFDEVFKRRDESTGTSEN